MSRDMVEANIQRPQNETEAKFAKVFAVCPDFITITARATGRYIDVNDAFTRIMGYDKAEVIGRTALEIGIWETPDERKRMLDALLSSPRLENFVVRIRRKNGEVIDSLLSVERTILGDEDCLIIVGRDISERRRVERALSASETRFRLAMDASTDGLWDWNVVTDQTYFSPAYFRMLGYEPDELPKLAQTWIDLIHPDDRQTALSTNRDCIDNRIESFSVEFRMKAKDGSWKWILGRGRAVERDPDGRALRMIGTHQDITERKRAEEALLHTTRKAMASNAELEQFAYVASHDLREPLRMISSYIALLERRYGNSFDPDAREFLHFASDGAQRMDRMVLDLLEFSRIGRKSDAFAPVALAEVIRAATKNLTLAIEESSAGIILPAALPTLVGSRGELVRLFQNLIGNALKYRHPERVPRIAITIETINDEWEISITDNGIGIASEYFDRIFGIFQRLHTREQYDGTGIGLAICKKVVEHHGGRIWVNSSPGIGSTFFFTLKDGAIPSA